MRFSIDEYSQHFKMSKEMIHSKLRSKKLNYIMENGETFIIVPRRLLDEEKKETIKEARVQDKPAPAVKKPKTTVGTIIALYQKENHQLKLRIKELEAKVDKLIDDKEQMLRDERDRIEAVYENKDAQLKNILELINSKMRLEQSQHRPEQLVDVEINTKDDIEATLETPKTNEKRRSSDHQLVALREYLKKLELKSSERKLIKKRFSYSFGHDVRIIQQNGDFYLDFSKYDYSDLLAH